MTCIQALPGPRQLISIGGDIHEGEKMGILLADVEDQLGAAHRIGLRVTLVPGLKEHIFSMYMRLADGVGAFFSRNKQAYLSTPKFIMSLISDPNNGLKTSTLDRC